MKSLQTKLTVIILVIFLVALSALGGLNYWKAREMISEDLNESLAKMAENSAGDVGDWLEARKAELTIMSVAPVVQSGNVEAITPFLANAVKVNKIYDSIGYALPSGQARNYAGIAVELSDREYFKRALKGEIAVSDPLLSKSNGHLICVVAIPVKVDGKVTGVLYGSVDMASLSQKVLEVKVGQTGYAYIVQGDGLIIIHPNKEVAMKANTLQQSNASSELKAATERMVKGDKGLIHYEYSGVDKVLAFAPVPGMNWALAVSVPTKELTGKLSALTIISLVTIIVVLLISSLAITVLTRRIVGPLRKLVVFAGEVAAGDIAERQRTIYSQDEIGQLADAMFEMRGNLRSLIKQVSASTDQVAASSEELTASAEQSAQAANQIAIVIGEVATGAEKQLKAVDDTADVVGQMSAGIQQIAANANSV
ncbi:MAG: methyl-accepting chemotaxis protein, partial [Negativicutes bacterium]|nr:methyl-accepting chemotaxis protein [Negativicutes bacterium]